MRGLSLIIGLIGVIAMLTLGVSGAWAAPASMSCHETSVSHGEMVMGREAPSNAPAPAKAQMVMGCCVACVSPSAPAVPLAALAAHPSPVQPTRSDLPHGRTPSPEHGPPRLKV